VCVMLLTRILDIVVVEIESLCNLKIKISVNGMQIDDQRI
jgi:hypothetical protein